MVHFSFRTAEGNFSKQGKLRKEVLTLHTSLAASLKRHKRLPGNIIFSGCDWCILTILKAQNAEFHMVFKKSSTNHAAEANTLSPDDSSGQTGIHS